MLRIVPTGPQKEAFDRALAAKKQVLMMNVRLQMAAGRNVERLRAEIRAAENQ